MAFSSASPGMESDPTSKKRRTYTRAGGIFDKRSRISLPHGPVIYANENKSHSEEFYVGFMVTDCKHGVSIKKKTFFIAQMRLEIQMLFRSKAEV